MLAARQAQIHLKPTCSRGRNRKWLSSKRADTVLGLQNGTRQERMSLRLFGVIPHSVVRDERFGRDTQGLHGCFEGVRVAIDLNR
jgi:hypothetical protein